MRAGMSGFALGVVALQQLPSLPGGPWLPAALLALPLLALRAPAVRLVAGLALGLGWATLHAHHGLAHRLPLALEGQDLILTGSVADLSEPRGHSTRFVFAPDQARTPNGEPVDARLPRRIRLSAYGLATPPAAGERWRLTVRLRPPAGALNDGGFDYERWLHQNRFDATGYVRAEPAPQRLTEGRGLHALREQIAGAIRERVGQGGAATLLPALAVADRSGMTEAQWSVLGATGTGHLLAISGLHIGLVAGFGFVVGGGVWRCLPALARRSPARMTGAAFALLLAAGYAALAGFTLPTQRALIMLGVALGALMLRRRPTVSHGLLVALTAVLILDPLAPLGPGFWLSFGAVAIIFLLAAHRRADRSGWWVGLRLHALISLALLPVIGWWFDELPLISAPANMLAIPVVAFLVVPPLLLGVPLLALLPPLSEALLVFSLGVLEGLMQGLAWLAEYGQWGDPAGVRQGLWVAAAGALLLLLPPGWFGRWLGLPLLALPVAAGPQPDAASAPSQLAVLDAGRGLISVLVVADRVLVYGSGARVGRGATAAERTLVPWLEVRGLRPDYLIPGGRGSAWTGGLEALRARYPQAHPVTTCEAGGALPPGVRLRPVAGGCALETTLGQARVRLTPSERPHHNGAPPMAVLVAPLTHLQQLEAGGHSPRYRIGYPVRREEATLGNARATAHLGHNPAVLGTVLVRPGAEGLRLECWLRDQGRYFHRPWPPGQGSTDTGEGAPSRWANPLSSRSCEPGP
ncbi:ComEC/Rec2 family competence protein [Alkalilimnicola ehrlichii MLHE-1]|uniref:ComEC/Rec2-related protein n=1 Tax=Alkalilimnicola ehrlichii (strain ATCC BAA-1101 / DSM 17681 / MLHE-1) TaxID=187272 RepID=Q0A8Q1_ALKEH|nr:ComEC/Rec2 family competence protein [Alkalilimnicola ehrlichii]ABI56786.1 ComEC/Rec2-related protein [Alkalilimnicola ehrlichii MLHE-1]